MFRPLLAALLLAPAAAFAASRPVVLELFTSESCSSCPPADDLFAELARTRSDLLPLAFHVDYWNALSWKDQFSSSAATGRQRRHATALDSEVYTPQLVVDGSWQAVGSDRGAVMAIIAKAQADQAAGPDVWVKAGNGMVTAHIGAGQGRGEVLLVGFDNLHTTSVGSGENAGRTVTEANVVRSLTLVGAWTGAPLSIRTEQRAGEQFALLVQDASARIIAAARN